MKVAITGGTGFIGAHLAKALLLNGHEVVIVSRIRKGFKHRGVTVAPIGLSDTEALKKAFANCDAVAHCAGINRELREQTYAAVHVDGTRNVINAAKAAGVRKIVYVSFLRARPACGSPYHESKFAAEEIVRASEMDFTVLNPV